MKSKLPIILTSIMLIAVCGWASAQPQTGESIAVTNTTNGKVRGYVNNGIYTYKGIPYAKAGRFETAQKPAKWEGVRSSLTYGPVSPLLKPTTSVDDESEYVFQHDWGYTSEDCLVLNVWTPSVSDKKKRPVLFWIHGGGFAAGSSQELASYDGESLANYGDVVVVSINHRLNILGFLDLSAYGKKYETSANNSILDMKMALEWVNENIANFGGDPGNVTIFGQSGGGAKVNTLMAMPSAKGLFHKAVNQSGAFASTMPTKAETQAIATEVLKELNIKKEEVDKIQSVPYQELADAGQRALKTISDKMKGEGKTISGFGLSWGPSVDGKLLPYQVSSDEAYELSKNIPLMIGTVKNEFMPSLRAKMTHATEEEVIDYLKKQHKEKADTFIRAAKNAYPSYKMPSDLMDIDLTFRPGSVQQANKKSALEGGAKTYMYLFTWQNPVIDGKYKAIHCGELPFVFYNVDKCPGMTGGTEEAYALAKNVANAWISFAKTGNPNHPGLPYWPAYNESNGANMIFDNQCEVRNHHDKELLDLMAQK